MSFARCLLAACALLGAGCHLGAGPVVAYAPGRGDLGLGWEANAGFAVLQGTVGQVLRPGAASADAHTTYVAFEPGYAAEITQDDGPGLGGGLTLGEATDGRGRDHFLVGGYGSFIGVGWHECALDAPFFSVSLGLRGFDEALEVYAAPKVNVAGLCTTPGL